MAGDISEAIGTVAEGALLARAAEPRRGEGGEAAAAGTCLNCGTALMGTHCHGCGQRAQVHKTLGAFLHDLLHGAFHFEGKIWHTLPLLAWKPGQLTRRYIDGERARFVSPMALFLFAVFLMFATFQLAGIAPPTDFGPPVQVSADEAGDARTLEEELAGLHEARKAMGDNNPASALIDRQIAAIEQRIAETADKDGKIVLAASEDKGSKLTYQRTGVAILDQGIDKWRANPGLMAYKLQSNSYKFSWLLIPLSVPFVWLLFLWRRRFGAYDHAVFVTYSLAFMTLFYVALVLLGGIGVSTWVLVLFGTFVPLVHIYKQLKGAYGLSRFSALWRTTILIGFICVILVLFLDLLLVLGAVD